MFLSDQPTYLCRGSVGKETCCFYVIHELLALIIKHLFLVMHVCENWICSFVHGEMVCLLTVVEKVSRL